MTKFLEHDTNQLQIYQLGPHAYEEHMPKFLSNLLSSSEQAAAENMSPPTIPLLKSLSEADSLVREARFCTSSVKHISKSPAEGNHFCGYRNIQVQLTYIMESFPSVLKSMSSVPSILMLQEMIENAWDLGINPNGRLQTGGIKDTRKHIGTQEACLISITSVTALINQQAQTLLKSLKLTCKVNAFHGPKGEKRAHVRLLDFVQDHYSSENAHTTGPIFLQQPHHSLTIVGIELLHDGSRRLLVFDPAFPATQGILDRLSNPENTKYSSSLIRPYRKTETQLARHKGFETLFVALA